MGLEKVSYKENHIYEDSVVLCRLQKFLYLFLSKDEHPEWFKEILKDIYGNSYLPIPKFFFDEDEIEGNPEHKKYILNMLNRSIDKMKNLTKAEFIKIISEEIKGTFCDISPSEDINHNESYNKYYIETLIKIKNMIE